MIVTNREVQRAAYQVFASGHAYVTPFYNRLESRRQIKALFDGQEDLNGSAFIIAAPFGTGKTFLIETVGHELGMAVRPATLRVPDISSAFALTRTPGRVMFSTRRI